MFVAEYPADVRLPRQDAERGRIRNHGQIGRAGHLFEPHAAAARKRCECPGARSIKRGRRHVAISLFLFSGCLMEHGGISKRLIAIADVLLGRVGGGLGLVTIGASMFFGALTGSGNTATAAVGSLMIPTMLKRGYDAPFAGAVTAIGGTMGILIPPSITLIVYGIIADVSIARLVLAGGVSKRSSSA